MNKFLIALVGVFLCLSVSTKVLAAEIPFVQEIQDRLDALEVRKIVKVTWSQPAHGTSTATAYSTGKYLPLGAIITRSWATVVTQLVDGGGNAKETNITLQCEDANNIFGPTAMTGPLAGTVVGGKQYGNAVGDVGGSAAGYTDSIAAACELQLKTTEDNATAGKVNFYVEYILNQ